MSDEQLSQAPEPGPEAPAQPGPESAAQPPADPFDDPNVTTFDRAYVERLRNEAAQRRVALKQYEVFEKYAPEDREILVGLAAALLEDPKAGAQQMLELAQAILGEGEDEGQAESEDEDAPLTKRELEELLAERERQRQEEQEIIALQNEAKSLGYEPGSREYLDLLWLAYNQTGGDLKKAHEALEAERQKIIEQYLETKKQQSEAHPRPGAGGVAPDSGEQIKDLRQARNSLEARLKALFG